MNARPESAVTHSRQRKLALLVGAVAVPALLLAIVASALTLRVGRQVRADSARYNAYLASRVAESFEFELLAQLREAVMPAENVAQLGGPPEAIVAALASRSSRFEAPVFVPVSEMDNLSIIMVESNMLLFGEDPSGRHDHPFAAVVLKGPRGDVIGAGGWWFNPRAFLAANLANVVRDRLGTGTNIYGGLESTRNLSLQVFDREGHEVVRLRTPGPEGSARSADLSGPFGHYSVRVAATENSPAAVAQRFVIAQMLFIGLMTTVLLGATVVGVRYMLRQMELVRVKSSFVSNVTHELKTPIAVIRLAGETLEMGRFRSPEEEEKYLRAILRETDRLTQLVDNILDFSKLESGQQVLRLVPIRVDELVANVLESFRLRLEDGGFQWQVDVPQGLPRIQADAIALQHCLLNLLDNAVKYSRERKEIRIVARAREDMVSIAVGDRGIGIGADDLPRIFEKFVRVETGLVHTVKGAGLGLSLVDQIVRAHHGRVEVASTPGEGSIFTMLIPVSVAGNSSPQEAVR
ncbi:MAG: HAMP domain-containing histidine kinase [Candidatus Eisenbacteria bacterium]|nr:HAMP domain-containing histidine kinase [Candidatus Eisenbacteria bacterium]